MADLSRVVTFTNVRLSYPHITAPQTNKDSKTGVERTSYGAALIMLPSDPNFVRFMQVVNQLATAAWKEQAPLVLSHIQRDTKGRCYVQGEEKVNSKTMLPNPESVGHIIISAYNKNMPQMVDAQGTPVDPANTMACQAIARKCYAGCRVNVALKPWLQNNDHGKGVRCELVAVQFHADDTPFGEGNVDVTGMFAPTEAPATPVFAAAPWNPPVAAAAPAWGAPATKPPSFM